MCEDPFVKTRGSLSHSSPVHVARKSLERGLISSLHRSRCARTFEVSLAGDHPMVTVEVKETFRAAYIYAIPKSQTLYQRSLPI